MRIPRPGKSFYKIGEAAEIVGVPAHVLRYWESEFPMVKPMKTRGSHRMYRPKDVELLVLIRKLMHEQGYTLDGARKQLRRRSPSKQPQEHANGGASSKGRDTRVPVQLTLDSAESLSAASSHLTSGTEPASTGQALGASANLSSEYSSEAESYEKRRLSNSEASLRMELFRVREQLRSLQRDLDQKSFDSTEELEEAIVVEHVVPKRRNQ